MIMTKLLKQILTICACALMFVSCKEPELTPSVEVSAFQHTFAAEGGNFSLTFSATHDWTITVTEGAEWLRINKSMGKAGSDIELTLTATENEVQSERSGSVTITADTAKATITLRQSAADAPPAAFIELTESEFDVKVEGAEVVIPFTTNYAWSAEVVEGEEWLTVVTEEGLNGESSATVKADLNYNPEIRAGKVKITANEASAEVVITQQPLVNRYAINGQIKEFGSIGAAKVGDNLCIVASLTQGYESYDEIAENDIDFFTAIAPTANGVKLDIMGEGENYTITSALAGAYLETVARELTDEVTEGTLCLTSKDGKVTLAERVVLVDGTVLSVGISIEADLGSSDNTISRGDEVKPLRALFYNEDEADYVGLYLTPAGLDYFDELDIATWYLYLLADRSLYADGSFDLSEVSADKIFYFGMVDNMNEDLCFEISNDDLAGATGSVSIEREAEGVYNIDLSITYDGTLYTAKFKGEAISYDVTPPPADTNYIEDAGRKYDLKPTATLTKGESVWSVELTVADNDKRVVITAPKGCFDGNARGFSQSKDLTVTYDGVTFSKANGYSGTITLGLDEEAGKLTAEFTNYAGFSLSFDGSVTIE